MKALQAAYHEAAAVTGVKTVAAAPKGGRLGLVAVLAWAAVGIPLAWGIWITLDKALILFE